MNEYKNFTSDERYLFAKLVRPTTKIELAREVSHSFVYAKVTRILFDNEIKGVLKKIKSAGKVYYVVSDEYKPVFDGVGK